MPFGSEKWTSVLQGVMGVFFLVCAQMVMVISNQNATGGVHLPLFLCQVQFMSSSLLSFLLLLWRKCRTGKMGLLPFDTLLKSSIPLSLCWTVGFVLFNFSTTHMSPSLVNLVRCSEPLATVLIGFFVLGKHYPPRVLLPLLPICGGVILTSFGGMEDEVMGKKEGEEEGRGLCLGGVIFACLSNIAFCCRPFLVKRGGGKKKDQPTDNLANFFSVTLVASLLLSPLMIILEGPHILSLIFRPPSPSLLDPPPADLIAPLPPPPPSSPLSSLTLASLSFFFYQLFQLHLMASLSPLAFSILTPLIKAVMIMGISFYFEEGGMGGWGGVGVLVTTGGGWWFSVESKRWREKKKEGTLLPLKQT